MKKLLKKALIISCVCTTVIPGGTFVFANNNPNSQNVNVEQEKSIRILTPKVKTETAKVFDYQQTKEKNTKKHTFKVTPSANDTIIELPYESNNGIHLKLYKNKEGKTGNAGNIYDKNGNSLGIFSVNVVDKQNTENLITSIDANMLKLTVQGTNSTEPYEIMLTTETTYYSTYFNSFEWINRGGTYPISLSLNHTNYIYEGSTQWDAAIRSADAWSKVVAVHSGSSNWSNAGGLEDQFSCHVGSAQYKNPWNIEPSRPDVSYAETVANLCNPGSGYWD
ncbi:DUF2599 domain-containing protein [Paenibacillus sp. SYP-B3998]|uniref:DUF2599 domain-containing protein n=1 Tax=Paenibacillus sp. SYP-B3998 TaxID=2678564 RepID=A0A6G4A447_9BACL|nr:DUF2599 domain-containing protein [Paenibacillus sp. SYP-B3998]NEW08591.1 DUF2599 domain-containing protein [Paenibacillus sp. SYP-B3998]